MEKRIPNLHRERKGSLRLAARLLLAILCLAAGCGRSSPRPDSPPRRSVQRDRLLVGAHYHVWFPENRKQGYLRASLIPPQQPLLGHYDSSDPAVIEQHIAWCSQYGIDFLTLDWWPGREQNRIILDVFPNAANIDDIQFCVFHETWSIGFDKKMTTTPFTPEAIERFVADMRTIAENLFSHPRYLRIDGRPVIILYLTRTFTGPYREVMAQVRAEWSEMGYDPFVIADEIYWGVIREDDPMDAPPLGSPDPQAGRIRLFDAITSYNMYCSSQSGHAGYAAESSFIDDVAAIYRRYREAAFPSVGFVPSLLSRYNDRGVRPRSDHFVIPSAYAPDEPEGSFLARQFERIGFELIDPDLNMILITSFNEWNEDTAIEPLEPAPPTQDRSRTGQTFTLGYPYAGFGMRYFEVIRDQVVAVSGRITEADGSPRRGVAIGAWQNGQLIAQATSDSYGWYRLSRMHLPPGAYELALLDQTATPRPVQVTPATTRTGIDFIAR